MSGWEDWESSQDDSDEPSMPGGAPELADRGGAFADHVAVSGKDLAVPDDTVPSSRRGRRKQRRVERRATVDERKRTNAVERAHMLGEMSRVPGVAMAIVAVLFFAVIGIVTLVHHQRAPSANSASRSSGAVVSTSSAATSVATPSASPSLAGSSPSTVNPPANSSQPAPTAAPGSLPAAPSVMPPLPPDPAVVAASLNWKDPAAVAAAWAAQRCASSWQQPVNNAVTRAAIFMTSAASAAEPAESPAQHQQAVESHLLSACVPLSATVSPEAPKSDTVTYVVIAGSRITGWGDGAGVQADNYSETRTVRRQSDGRWLVDVAVAGG